MPAVLLRRPARQAQRRTRWPAPMARTSRRRRYLGLRHPSAASRVDRAHHGPPGGARRAAAPRGSPRAGARSRGQAALLARSTLHGFIDVPGRRESAGGASYWSMRGYTPSPGGRCTACRAGACRVSSSRHHDAADLTARCAARGRGPARWYSPTGCVPDAAGWLRCGRTAAIAAASGGCCRRRHASARRTRSAPEPGVALRPRRRRIAAVGRGGPGRTVCVSSLAKGFGAPLAVVAGDARLVAWWPGRGRSGSTPARRRRPTSRRRGRARHQRTGGRAVAGAAPQARAAPAPRAAAAGDAAGGGRCLPVQPVGPLPRQAGPAARRPHGAPRDPPVLQRLRQAPACVTWVVTARHQACAIAARPPLLGGAPADAARWRDDPCRRDPPLVVIDAHCHAGKGDGLTGPWDTDASLGDYCPRAAAAGITRTVLFRRSTPTTPGRTAEVARSSRRCPPVPRVRRGAPGGRPRPGRAAGAGRGGQGPRHQGTPA